MTKPRSNNGKLNSRHDGDWTQAKAWPRARSSGGRWIRSGNSSEWGDGGGEGVQWGVKKKEKAKEDGPRK